MMQEQAEKKLNKVKALAAEWKRDPRFKETCKSLWDPNFFAWCEKKIAELEAVKTIEVKHQFRDDVKFLDISEIDCAAWEAQ